MARAATTSDVFNAIAEPRRRAILDLLLRGEKKVNDLVEALGITQPAVSKHLRILKDVGLVQIRCVGRLRMYRADGRKLRAVHAWTERYEQFWNDQLSAIKNRAEAAAKNDRRKKGNSK